MLSGVDSRTRLYFYLLRRPIQFADESDDAASSVAALGRRKRRAFLTERVQDVSAYVAWAHDPHLSAVTMQKTGGPWWMAYAKNWMARRRNRRNSVYLHSSIESAAASFRQLVEASRALVDDLTPIRLLKAYEASLVLNELTNRPGTFWDGATGSGMNWRLAVSELEAERRNLRLDGEPVILYSLLSPPGAARANLLQALYQLDATMTINGARSASIQPGAKSGGRSGITSQSATPCPRTSRKPKGQRRRWWTRRRQVRSVFVSAGAVACMAPIFGPPVGTPRSAHLLASLLAPFGRAHLRVPHRLDIAPLEDRRMETQRRRPSKFAPASKTSTLSRRPAELSAF